MVVYHVAFVLFLRRLFTWITVYQRPTSALRCWVFFGATIHEDRSKNRVFTRNIEGVMVERRFYYCVTRKQHCGRCINNLLCALLNWSLNKAGHNAQREQMNVPTVSPHSACVTHAWGQYITRSCISACWWAMADAPGTRSHWVPCVKSQNSLGHFGTLPRHLTNDFSLCHTRNE